MKNIFYINDQFVEEDQAKISILDLAVLRGFGVFDYLRTYQGRPFHLWDHLLRFRSSVEQVGLNLPYELSKIAAIVEEALLKNGFEESNIKILLTAGVSVDQFLPGNQPLFAVLVYPLQSYPTHFYDPGVRVITTRFNRNLPTSKTTQYLPAIVAMKQAREKALSEPPQEVLYLHSNSTILEGTTSNFFAIKDGALITCCSEDVLCGITRKIVLNLVKDRMPIEERALVYDEIGQIQEAFLTSSSREIMPITQIDMTPIGNKRVGIQTQHIMELFKNYTCLPQWDDSFECKRFL